jgi:ribose-phosphate pyrophosphokinase
MTMQSPLLIAFPGNEALADKLAATLGWETGQLEVRHFPDGESYVRFHTEVRGRALVLVSTLDRPDAKMMALYFAACTARDLGARRVGLLAPYLSYMRQDKCFNPGEGITAAQFARFVSGAVDWLVTADPHLHRIHALDEVYSIPSRVVRAAPEIARWVAANVPSPLIVGPDGESEQWVSAVASDAGCPFTVLTKIRRGDRDVEVSLPQIDAWRDCTPVLVDDIASSARTMVAAVKNILATGMRAPVCVAVHPIFAQDAYDILLAAGPARVVSCNTIAHASNAIDMSGALATAVQELVRA